MSVRSGSVLLALMLAPQLLLAQEPISGRTQVEVGIGLASPYLQRGTELMRSRELREEQQSYFERSDGTRRHVGNYSPLVGFSVHIGFHRSLGSVDGLMLGAVARTTLTGSQPSSGGYAEGYFFNTVTMGASTRYYPLEGRNLFLRGEAGVGAVLTKDRFINDSGTQSYFHQFGIGPSATAGIGYSLTPFRDRTRVLDLQALYQQMATRVEVDGIGDDLWSSGTLQVVVGVSF